MTHGGARRGAGRPPIAGGRARSITVRLPPEVEAEITDGLHEGETLASVLAEGGLQLVRARSGVACPICGAARASAAVDAQGATIHTCAAGHIWVTL